MIKSNIRPCPSIPLACVEHLQKKRRDTRSAATRILAVLLFVLGTLLPVLTPLLPVPFPSAAVTYPFLSPSAKGSAGKCYAFRKYFPKLTWTVFSEYPCRYLEPPSAAAPRLTGFTAETQSILQWGKEAVYQPKAGALTRKMEIGFATAASRICILSFLEITYGEHAFCANAQCAPYGFIGGF